MAQQTAGTAYKTFSAGFAAPALSGVGLATLTYTAGSVYNGGHANSIVAGTLTSLGASKSDCSSASIIIGTDSCTYVYWTSSTALSKSSTYATAAAPGNVIVAFLTTDSDSKILTIVPATMMIPNPLVVAYTCGTSASCAAPAALTAPIKYAHGTVAMSSATSVNVSGLSPAFTGVSTYSCSATNQNGHAYTSGVEATSASAFTILSGTSNSDTWNWVCVGY
jgi:hypothetical protein